MAINFFVHLQCLSFRGFYFSYYHIQVNLRQVIEPTSALRFGSAALWFFWKLVLHF